MVGNGRGTTEKTGAECEITGVLAGLTEGKHGLHILEYGDISEGMSLIMTVVKCVRIS